jgi:hypothetical protein
MGRGGDILPFSLSANREVIAGVMKNMLGVAQPVNRQHLNATYLKMISRTPVGAGHESNM